MGKKNKNPSVSILTINQIKRKETELINKYFKDG